MEGLWYYAPIVVNYHNFERIFDEGFREWYYMVESGKAQKTYSPFL
ncbi:MAG: hypothetical protein ACUVQ9_13715 [Thermodesulfobacteriota bacterium]